MKSKFSFYVTAIFLALSHIYGYAGQLEDAKSEFKKENYQAAYSQAFELSKGSNNYDAKSMVAGMKFAGKGTDKDSVGAVQIWTELAKADYLPAQAILGALYLDGSEIGKDYRKAKFYLEAARTKKHPEATYNLGFMYQNGLGVEASDAKALQLYADAAELGYGKALYQLGILTQSNLVPDSTPEKACDFYQKAGEAGSIEGSFLAGKCFATGFGKPKDLPAALTWYKSAAMHSFPMAQANLGYMFEKGLGVPVDLLAAYKWYWLASSKVPAAAKKITELERSGKLSPEEISEKEKHKWLQELASSIESEKARKGIISQQ